MSSSGHSRRRHAHARTAAAVFPHPVGTARMSGRRSHSARLAWYSRGPVRRPVAASKQDLNGRLTSPFPAHWERSAIQEVERLDQTDAGGHGGVQFEGHAQLDLSMSARTNAMSPFVATSWRITTPACSAMVESVSVEVVVPCRCDDRDVDLQQRLSKWFRLVHISNSHLANLGPRVIVRRPELRILE